MQGNPYQPHELTSGTLVLEEAAGERRGGCNGILLLHSAYLHAHVGSLYDNAHTQRMQGILDTVADLDGKPLLDLKTAGITLHHTGDLAESGDIAVGNIGHMGLSIERQQVMLAHGVQLNILDNHHLTVVFLEHRRTQNLGSVHMVTLCQELHALGHPFRGLEQSLAFRILPQQAQHFLIMYSKFLSDLRIVFLYLIIRLEDIRRIYRVGNQEVRALDGVSLSVYKNEYVAIMGPSGSGKSTLMNILGCLDSPSSGHYVLNGVDVSEMEDSDLADVRNREIGFVFQSFNLLPRYNALENVALPMIYAGVPARERMERAADALRSVALEERMDHKPNELSGGQKQRVALARALINNPSIILADEPTGNLDTHTSIEIMRLFDEIYRKGNTVIVVTHEEDIAAYAHRIIRLRDGKIESDKENTKYTRTFNPL